MALCTDVFAEPMPDDDENFLQKYAEKLGKLQKEGHLPADLKKEMAYKVYSIEGSSCGAHRSIVLSSDDQRFFSMELGFIVVDGIKRVYPVTQKIDSSYKSKLTYHGTVMLSTDTLLARGVATLKKFGGYFKFCNNCQNFCNYYLDSIGLAHTKKMTDNEKASVIAIAVGICALLLTLIVKVFKK